MSPCTPTQARKLATKLECAGPLTKTDVVDALRSLAEQLDYYRPPNCGTNYCSCIECKYSPKK